ncbi:hypothetical protein ACIBI9_31265 [Nonomuraea sp. NPDC050451]|uniref:hypothetical protein n=1 Tax=Nonomuraea sp. NPDC050451 TaxID=3364364 RepID=UPI0037A6EDE5
MTFLVLDPGETTGLAEFDDAGSVFKVTQISGVTSCGMTLEETLHGGGVRRILYETFKVFGNVNLTGSDVPAAKVIGIIEYLALKYNVPCEGIDPKYKRIGYAWSGKRPPSNHSKSHGPDAEALGEYWLRKNGVKDINA